MTKETRNSASPESKTGHGRVGIHCRTVHPGENPDHNVGHGYYARYEESVTTELVTFWGLHPLAQSTHEAACFVSLMRYVLSDHRRVDNNPPE